MFGRNKVALLVAELVGTMLLTLGVMSVRSSGIGYSFFVALGAGLAMGALTLALATTSGAQLNPALTFGLWVTRQIKTLPGVLYIVMQLVGGVFAWGIYSYFAKQHLPTAAGHYEARVMLAEALGTFVFVFGWMAAVGQKMVGLKLAVASGSAFALGILVAALGSNGVINPAVALGTRAWAFWGAAGWLTYLVGPVMGGLVGALMYVGLFSAPVKAAVAAKKK
jgi:aquaporin Z